MKRLLYSILCVATAATAAVPADSVPVFEKDVLPIFSTYCFTCHGKSSPELGVDLRTARSVLRGGFNGPVIQKGSAEESRLFQKVSKAEMPPPAFNSKVPEADVETIRRWIEGGTPSQCRGRHSRDRPTADRAVRERDPAPSQRAVRRMPWWGPAPVRPRPVDVGIGTAGRSARPRRERGFF